MTKIRLKTTAFSIILLETLDTGVTIMTVKDGEKTIEVPLLPEELGMLMIGYGNSVTEGRAEELERLKEHNLMVEKRKIKKEEEVEGEI